MWCCFRRRWWRNFRFVQRCGSGSNVVVERPKFRIAWAGCVVVGAGAIDINSRQTLDAIRRVISFARRVIKINAGQGALEMRSAIGVFS